MSVSPDASSNATEPSAVADRDDALVSPGVLVSLVRLARPTQWIKSAFVLVGPFYGLRLLQAEGASYVEILVPAMIAAVAFALASSGCYVFNDLFDRVADRAHPRKRRRPIAAGHVSLGLARWYACGLFVASALLVFALPPATRPWVGLTVLLYVSNVLGYSIALKKFTIADVISLSIGFVLRVMGGCAAVGISPSDWLLNVTFFLSMFLAFGKRLGERRTLGSEAHPEGGLSGAERHRSVQGKYTDALLQMAVVVTAVATLMTYAFYVQDQGNQFAEGFNLLWLTIIPATYGLLRIIVVLDRGRFDDPTEVALHDRGIQLSALAFAGLTVALVMWRIVEPAP